MDHNILSGALGLPNKAFHIANFPAELRTGAWGWCSLAPMIGGGVDKQPRHPFRLTAGRNHEPLKTNDPAGWATYEECCAKAWRDGGAVGRLFQHGEGFVAIDIDYVPDGAKGVTDVSALRRWQKQVFDWTLSYTELSQSGNGLHIIVKAQLPGGTRRTGVEIYGHRRFMICTGNVVPERRGWSVVEDQEAIDELVDFLTAGRGVGEASAATLAESLLSDDEAEIEAELLIDRASRARNGDKFRQLMTAPPAEDGRSEQDMALAERIAFWTSDAKVFLAIFRQSPLHDFERKARKSGYNSMWKYESGYLVGHTFRKALGYQDRRKEAAADAIAAGQAIALAVLASGGNVPEALLAQETADCTARAKALLARHDTNKEAL